MAVAACSRSLCRPGIRRLPLLVGLPKPLALRSRSAASESAASQQSHGRGLQLKRELRLYESSVDLHAVAEAAVKKCHIAAGLGAIGFTSIIVAAQSNASPGMLVGMGCLGLLSTYVTLEVPKRAMRGVALKQVERIVLLPTGADSEQAAPTGSAAERLAATEALDVEVWSPNLVRRVRLEQPPSAWQGTRYTGLVADTRRSFADACRRLHVDVNEGKCADNELLDALLSSGNVVAEEKLEIRSDVDGYLRLPLDGGTPPGASLAEAPTEDADKYEPPDFAKSTPAAAIESLGTRSTFTGVALLTLGIVGYTKHMMKAQGALAPEATPRKP